MYLSLLRIWRPRDASASSDTTPDTSSHQRWNCVCTWATLFSVAKRWLHCIKRPVPLASRLYFLVTNVARYHFHCVTTSYCYNYRCIISVYLVARKIGSSNLTFFIIEYKLVDINKFLIPFLSGIEQIETSRNYRFNNREFELREEPPLAAPERCNNEDIASCTNPLSQAATVWRSSDSSE